MGGLRGVRGRRRARRARGERGAAVTEFVLIAPVLVLLVAAVLEFGLAFRDNMTMSNALRSGARVGSNAGRERLADYTILKAVEAAMAEVPTSQIQRIIVYKADTANSAVPSSCLSVTPPGGVTGVCNVYNPASLSLPESEFSGTTCSASAPDRWWCPVSRQSQQALGADYLGVWMEIEYDYVTHLFPGDGLTLRDRAIMRLEPRLT